MADSIEVERRAPFGDNPVVGERGAKTQRRILQAALHVFAEHGYHDSSVEQITRAAGCSRPTFYQYFSSKEDVFRALARSVGRSVVEMTERLVAVTPDEVGRAALVGWLDELTDFYEEHAPVFSAFSAAVRSDAGLAGGSAVVSVAFGRALRPHLDVADSPVDVDVDVMASVVVTMIMRANLLRYGTPGLVSRRRFVDGLATLVHRVLVGAQAGLDRRRPSTVRPPARLRRSPSPADDGAGSRSQALSVQGQHMRARLVEAGTVVFPRLGFHDTRVDDVVAEAGVSHGSYYRYFENKEDLFQVIAHGAASQLIERLDAFPADATAGSLRTWLTEWFGVYARHGAIIALWREMEFSDPAVETMTRGIADAALGGLMRVLEAHGVGDPLVNAMAFLGLIETIPHHVHGLGYFDQEAAIEAMVAIIVRGFLGDDLTAEAAC